MILSSDQTKALKILLSWIKEPNSSYITLGGYAGTGKTTLIALLRKKVNELLPNITVAFCAYTGKATRVLAKKFKKQIDMYKQDSVSTIHSLIYKPIVGANEQIVGWEKRPEIKADLIIIDEASMISRKIWTDLLSYKKSIIAVGDHGQLPPINDTFNLLKTPNIRLEEIHRQAKNDPIIKLSMVARKSGIIPSGRYSKRVVKYDLRDPESNNELYEQLNNYNNETFYLCGYNRTRVKINKYIRRNNGYFSDIPEAGDKIICLRNNHSKGIYNGMLGVINTISQEDKTRYFITADLDDVSYSGFVYIDNFNNLTSSNFTDKRKYTLDIDLFDYGYAMTVHKSQGSQSAKVVLLEESFKHADDDYRKRWLYTAITRAESDLVIFGY